MNPCTKAFGKCFNADCHKCDEQQAEQGPIGEASSDESGVQSAAEVIAKLRAKAIEEQDRQYDCMRQSQGGSSQWHRASAKNMLAQEFIEWLDEVSGCVQIQHEDTKSST